MSSSGVSDSESKIVRIIESPVFKVAIPLLIVAIGIFVLHELASHVSWSDVKADAQDASPIALLASVAATGLSFIGISFYDMLAVQSIAKGRVPLRIAAVAGACGYAVSNLLGFSYLTGTAVRYRIYASLGLDLGLVAGVIATSWVAFWMGLTVILGGLIAFHPAGLNTVIDLSNEVETAIGLALLSAIVLLFVWLSRGKRRLELFGMGLDLPGFKLSLSLTGAACIDILGASLALYVFMPADLVQSFPYFFVVYIAAISFGLLSHAPAGLGVFEATIIAGMGASGRSDVLAALLLYRMIYTVLPFALATLGLGGIWVKSNTDRIGSTTSWSYRIAKPIVPMIAAGVSLLAGATLLISGSLPADVATLRTLQDVL
ncbi:MAG: oxacillin resistance protein FmtC, partial [Paracoccaceae bacterium]